MHPVVGLDVAKAESQVQAYLERSPTRKVSSKTYTRWVGSLLVFIKEIDDISGERPPLLMESMGHYTPLLFNILRTKAFYSLS